jgi:nucleolar protein 56
VIYLMPPFGPSMEIVTWFGREDPESGSFFPAGGEAEMIDALLAPGRGAGPCPSPQEDLRALARACGFVRGDEEYNARLRRVALGLARRRLKALATEEQDLLQEVEAFDDVTEAANLLDERLYEWSRLHQDEKVHGRNLAEALSEDEIMGELARTILELRRSRAAFEGLVGASAQRLAPNLSLLAGPILAARLISRAGGLKRLAEMPSSSIQIMGAEKALFKHLKGQAASPKHGIIYRHPAVNAAPKRLRGRVARALAGKLAIASRLDYFGAGPSLELRDSLDRRLAEIRRRGRRESRKKN